MSANQQLVDGMQRLLALGLNRGATGNLSIRQGTDMLITPSGIPAEQLTPETIVTMALAEESPPLGASSEWHFHRAIYRARSDAAAVVHVHSPHATALACQRRPLPPFHYMVAMAGGHDVRCTPYATFGTPTLSEYVLDALRDRQACLLANHGLVSLGDSVSAAIALAMEIESLSQQYLLALGSGEPVLLSASEMREVVARFKTYGKPHGNV